MDSFTLVRTSTLTYCFLFLIASITTRGTSIGVNYGTVADDLPPPSEVARFISKSTSIDRVRLFDTNPDILQAFAHSGVAITVTIPNDQTPHLTDLNFCKQWLQSNVQPYLPATNIVRIMVGNEVLATGNNLLLASLVPAMHTLYMALKDASLDRNIKVSTPHSLGVLSASSPPSTGRFRQEYAIRVLKPLLAFLRDTNSSFMINPYPYFGFSADSLDYALFRPNAGVLDENTELTYTNMLDGQLDAVYSAMKALGFADVEIVIAETGWPSRGDGSQLGVDPQSAAQYNMNLMRHVTSGNGTPLMPNRTFETYIFALFNEDLKPGPTCERNFGLFDPDMRPVYNIGIIRHTVATAPGISTPAPVPMAAPIRSRPAGSTDRIWCLPKSDADVDDLQGNIDYVCGLGVDCGPIKPGGECFLPNTVRAHAAFAMNKYYQAYGRNDNDCDFRQTGAITNVDPSYGKCKY